MTCASMRRRSTWIERHDGCFTATTARLPPCAVLLYEVLVTRILSVTLVSLAGHIAESQRRLAGLLVPLVVGARVFRLIWLAETTIGQSFAVRVAISVTTLTLAGAMMGMPFPLGMAQFDNRDRSWYWAINGATSVLASVLALVIALIAGFAVVLGCAVASYLIAAFTLPAQQPGGTVPLPPDATVHVGSCTDPDEQR